MKLRDYRRLRNMTLQQVADALGAGGAATVYRWETGQSLPGRDYMNKIKAWSDGAVTPADFYEGLAA